MLQIRVPNKISANQRIREIEEVDLGFIADFLDPAGRDDSQSGAGGNG